jgi:serine/threonine protein kinase
MYYCVPPVSLAAGSRLGAYEVVALIGSGGMGEVYRARDPRLGRDVAIKVLPSSLAGDADREDSGKPFAFLATQFREDAGAATAPVTTGGKWLVSQAGGRLPKWRRDGREIFYVSPAPNSTLMAADVNGQGNAFEVGAVKNRSFESIRLRPVRGGSGT